MITHEEIDSETVRVTFDARPDVLALLLQSAAIGLDNDLPYENGWNEVTADAAWALVQSLRTESGEQS